MDVHLIAEDGLSSRVVGKEPRPCRLPGLARRSLAQCQQLLDEPAGLDARETFHRCLLALLREPLPPALTAMA